MSDHAVEKRKKEQLKKITHEMLRRYENGDEIETPAKGFPLYANANTSHEALVKIIQKDHEHNEQVVVVTRDFNNFILQDVCVQAQREFEEKSPAFAQGTFNMFTGPQPPKEMQVPIGYGEFTTVAFGSFVLPAMGDASVEIGGYPSERGVVPFISFEVKRKYKDLAEAILDGVAHRLKHQSIFIGKAFELTLTDEDGGWLDMPVIRFLDTENAILDRAKIVFNRFAERVMDVGILGRIVNWASYKLIDGGSRYGALLHGDPGTGKTLVMRLALALNAIRGGVSILVKRAEDAVSVLSLIAPQWADSERLVLVAFEDVDRIAGKRDKMGQALTLALDGADNKHLNIMTIVTTNNFDDIIDVVKRRGRFNTHLEMPLPDQDARERLLRVYGGALLPHELDLTGYAAQLEGVIPADITAIIDDAKISGVTRLDGEIPTSITNDDLDYAVGCFLEQRRHSEPEVEEADVVKAARALGAELAERLRVKFPLMLQAEQTFGADEGLVDLEMNGMSESQVDEMLPW